VDAKTCTERADPTVGSFKRRGLVKIVIHKNVGKVVFTIINCRIEDCILIRRGNVELWIG